MNPLVSVIIPVRDDDAALGRETEANLHRWPDVEVLVVPGTRRGQQMNAGAGRARGEWLLFLHADSRLPDGWLDAIRSASPAALGGWFRFALDDRAWQARVIERGVALRVRVLRLPYGDQGIFVRAATFRALGGYRDLPFLEDVEFVRRLVRAGAVLEVPLPLVTSARRWRRDGWFRRSARNLAIVTGYFAGVAPARLLRWYASPLRHRAPRG
jgi:glycosyltransferase involved in cell wall biosynthesis